MKPDVELAVMMCQWANATGAAKDILFNQIITFLVNNPGLGQTIARNGGAFAAAYAAATRIPFSVFVARLTANFARTPKGPPPVIAAMVVGSIIVTSGQANAETQERQNAVPAYEDYVITYMNKIAKAKEYHPHHRFESPKTFDEWYQENY